MAPTGVNFQPLKGVESLAVVDTPPRRRAPGLPHGLPRRLRNTWWIGVRPGHGRIGGIQRKSPELSPRPDEITGATFSTGQVPRGLELSPIVRSWAPAWFVAHRARPRLAGNGPLAADVELPGRVSAPSARSVVAVCERRALGVVRASGRDGPTVPTSPGLAAAGVGRRHRASLLRIETGGPAHGRDSWPSSISSTSPNRVDHRSDATALYRR